MVLQLMPGPKVPWLRLALGGVAVVLAIAAALALGTWVLGPRLRAAENKALQATTDETVAVQQGELQSDVAGAVREFTTLQPIIVERTERAAVEIENGPGADGLISPDVYAGLVGVLGDADAQGGGGEPGTPVAGHRP